MRHGHPRMGHLEARRILHRSIASWHRLTRSRDTSAEELMEASDTLGLSREKVVARARINRDHRLAARAAWGNADGQGKQADS